LSLQKARRSCCAEVILAIDLTARDMERRHGHLRVASIVKSFSSLRPRLLYYTRRQSMLARWIDWNWVDCWLTWVNALTVVGTRHALLHDFDAVVVDPDFCEQHYDVAVRKGSTFTGIQRDWRFDEHAELLTTAELMLDAAAIRSLFKPIDLFNCVRMHHGRRIKCDILRDAQLRLPASARTLHKVTQEQIVHPSQVISQWHGLRQAAADDAPFTPEGYSPLFVIPYFRHVRGDSSSMLGVADALESGKRTFTLEGGVLDVTSIDQAGADWVADQIERLDTYFTGGATPIVRRFCTAIRRIVDRVEMRGRSAPVIESSRAAPLPR
jgi:hypothetical protein